MKTLDQIVVTLRSKTGELCPVYINVVDNPLSCKWLYFLNDNLERNLHLEKNYHWMGFTERDADRICLEINECISKINSHADSWQDMGIKPYIIDDHFTPDTVIAGGDVGPDKPGLKIIHERTNWLHRYFEDLQGHSGNIASYYKLADPSVKLSIRKLNLLCHELESYILSERKRHYAPEWVQCNQLFCFLNTPRFKLDPETDFDLFGVHTLYRNLGEVYIGVNKAVSKTHWEVFQDEKDADIDDLITTSLRPQIEACADFDIYWSKSTAKDNPTIQEFREWLKKHNWDPEDPGLTIGNPLIAQVDLQKSFGTEDSAGVQSILTEYLDVYKIQTSDSNCTYSYHWSDSDYNQRQIKLL